MIISRKIGLICTFIAIGLILVLIIYNTNVPTIENDVANDLNEAALSDETALINSEISEGTVNTGEIEESDEESKEDESIESENDISIEAEDDIIGNDLAIEHSPEHVGSFVIINSIGFEKFKFNKYNANVYIDSINKYAANLDGDITIYNLIAPTSSEFNMPDEYSDLSDSQKDGILYAYSNMDNKVITVDAYSNIEANKDEYLYFKTDHHWTGLGAYRAYESFMKTKSEEPISLEKYKKIDSRNKYLGSIYNMTQNERLENNLDDIWYYNPLLPVKYSAINRDATSWNSSQIVFPSYFEHSRKYSVFMGGDAAFSHIEVDSQVKKKILVIKDSYGNAFIPFLLPHYGDIFIADPRYFNDNIYELIEENKIDDVLIINYSTVLQLPVFSQMLGDMGTGNATSAAAINAAVAN
ncbi:DHHW family protein [Sedimentibacter sp.]|uniref:DHHW family protein n=1 Tax=Sedimentibacter sp. TaxID=1960295 RepID=UPI0028B15D03|nr:DHHW family protein [Sedimentibacter sp.]